MHKGCKVFQIKHPIIDNIFDVLPDTLYSFPPSFSFHGVFVIALSEIQKLPFKTGQFKTFFIRSLGALNLL